MTDKTTQRGDMKLKGIRYKLLDNEAFPRFVRLYKEFVSEKNEGELSDTFFDGFIQMSIMNMKNNSSLYLLALRGKKVIGFIFGNTIPCLDNVKSMHIEALYVKPEYRNAGIGKTLFDVAIAWMKNNGYKRLYAYEYPNETTWTRKKNMGFTLYRKLIVKEV